MWTERLPPGGQESGGLRPLTAWGPTSAQSHRGIGCDAAALISGTPDTGMPPPRPSVYISLRHLHCGRDKRVCFRGPTDQYYAERCSSSRDVDPHQSTSDGRSMKRRSVGKGQKKKAEPKPRTGRKRAGAVNSRLGLWSGLRHSAQRRQTTCADCHFRFGCTCDVWCLPTAGAARPFLRMRRAGGCAGTAEHVWGQGDVASAGVGQWKAEGTGRGRHPTALHHPSALRMRLHTNRGRGVSGGDNVVGKFAWKGGGIFIWQNSIAFGSAPRREADSQRISQLVRPAVGQAASRASRQADRNTQFGFFFQWQTRLQAVGRREEQLRNAQWSSGKAVNRRFRGRRFEHGAGQTSSASRKSNRQPTWPRSAALPLGRSRQAGLSPLLEAFPAQTFDPPPPRPPEK